MPVSKDNTTLRKVKGQGSPELAEAFAFLFKGRTDSHGRVEVCIYEPVTLDHYEKHLKGEVNLGIYFLLDDSTCHFFGIDLDEKDFNKAKAIRDELSKNDIPAYIAALCRLSYALLQHFSERIVPTFVYLDIEEPPLTGSRNKFLELWG